MNIELQKGYCEQLEELVKIAYDTFGYVRTEPTMEGSVIGHIDRKSFITGMALFSEKLDKFCDMYKHTLK